MGQDHRLHGVAAHPGGRAARCRAGHAISASSFSRLRTTTLRSRARAAWIAAFRSARAAARSTTSFRTGTISSIASSGAPRSTRCIRPTTFRSSPGASAPRRARRRARSTSTTTRSASSRSSISSSTRAGRKAGSCRSRRREDRQARRRRRLGPGGARVRAAARARGTRRRAVREGRPHRRVAALRHSRFQDGEAPDRPAHGADVDRRRRVPTGRRGRQGRRRARASGRTTTPSCLRAVPRLRAICRCPGRDLDGVHFAMDFLPQQNKVVAGDRSATRSSRPASTSS